MAENTLKSSQESLPLSQETVLLLMNNLGDFDTLLTDVLKEKTLEERFEEISEELLEEKANSDKLKKLNEEMSSAIRNLHEKLQNEIKGREQLEKVKVLNEIRLKENEMIIKELQQQLARKEEELNQTRMKCYEEATAKAEVLWKLQEIDFNSSNIPDLSTESNAHAPNQEQIESILNRVYPDDYSTHTVWKTPSSLPATESWPGEYNFRVSFRAEENAKNQWVYSARKNKLYVNKDTPCPINFSTSAFMSDFCIRTTAFFSSADHILNKVTRCVNHSMLEIKDNKPEAEHLVRVESVNAIYTSDHTGRHSVVVPYENPPAGQQFSCYIFKFACFQSCSGGPNRRPLMLCFTLEHKGIVLGRQKVHLKICACPLRDFKMEEKPLLDSSENQTKKKAVKRERESSETPQKEFLAPNYDRPVKIRPGPYYLKIDDRRNYEMLKFIAKVYLQPSTQPLHRSSLINLIRSTYSSSEEEEKK